MRFPREIDGFSWENMFKGFRGFSQRFFSLNSLRVFSLIYTIEFSSRIYPFN